MDFTFNPNAARALGTISPSHDFDIQSNEAINVPPRIRVYQNNRNSEAQGELIPIQVGISANEVLEDLIYDSSRQRIYIANSGMNRVEVFRYRATQGAGAHQGGATAAVDGDTMQTAGRVKFPPTPMALNQAISTPAAIAPALSGPLFLMTIPAANGTSTGSIWQVVGSAAVQKGPDQVIGTATGGAAKTVSGPFSMAATPGGEFIVIAGADGSTYLYDGMADQFVQSRTPNTTFESQGLGDWGPITAGPKGQYYVLNGQQLNQTLDAVNVPASGTTARPVAGVAPGPGTSYIRFTQAARTSTRALATDAGTFDLVDTNTGGATRSVAALEGPMAQTTTTARRNGDLRTNHGGG